MTPKHDFAALIGSRICHDLISPIGAIGNGVELMQMELPGAGPEMALISESVANANARIRFFRVAFGAASEEQRIGRGEVASILSDLMRGVRLSVDWQGPVDMARAEVKVVFLLIQCLETAMPYGGRITVAQGTEWTVEGQAPRFRDIPAFWSLLDGASGDVSPAQVQFALAPAEAARIGRTIARHQAGDTITLSF
ncbi:histidine phosphotransferase family protein [Cereibacter sp. SYSU M97828]|nr:histidine phosphotransferase family protein [Cereibacter flavus]